MTESRSCEDCKHCDQWEEYGIPMSDCRLATKDSKQVSDGRLTEEEYNAKHAVYLTVIDCGGDFEQTATYCPNFVQLEGGEG